MPKTTRKKLLLTNQLAPGLSSYSLKTFSYYTKATSTRILLNFELPVRISSAVRDHREVAIFI